MPPGRTGGIPAVDGRGHRRQSTTETLARDPQTGQFTSGQSRAVDFDLYDVQHFRREVSISAADNDGSTGEFGGQRRQTEPFDLMQAGGGINRGWVLDLVRLDVRLLAWINSTQTADGTVQATMAISTGGQGALLSDSVSASGSGVIASDPTFDELSNIPRGGDVDADVLTYLTAIGFGPITDGAAGVGGAGTVGEDEDRLIFDPDEGPTFGHDDDITAELEIAQWNVADAATHATLLGRAWWRPRRHPEFED